MPIGVAITVASATMSAVPTIALAIPPPPPLMTCGGSWMRKPTDSDRAPRCTTTKMTIASTATAAVAQAVAPAWTNRLTSARRRRFPEATSGAVGSKGGGSNVESSDKGPVHVVAPRDPAGGQIDGERHRQQDQREVEERRLLQLVLDVPDLDRDPRRQRVARQEQRGLYRRGRTADDGRDGDRLAERSSEAQHHRCGHPGERRRQHDPPDDLPAGGAQRL